MITPSNFDTVCQNYRVYTHVLYCVRPWVRWAWTMLEKKGAANYFVYLVWLGFRSLLTSLLLYI